ncbi:acyl-CoA dehydrogenase family protein, partial [Alcanivorax sp. HI0044]|uniref:acyl-CoA dehydrogenase family protein n=3 Tax=Alcanivorax TaxID=59753 RepID=UPI000A99E021
MSALNYFNETHQMVRDTVRKFVEREILPEVDDWEEAGEFPRELYKTAANAGILGINAPEEFGGTGEDVFMKIAACEELVRCSSGGLCASLGSLDIGLPPVWK